MAGPAASVLATFKEPHITWRALLEPFAAQWAEDGRCWIRDGKGSDNESLRPLVGSIHVLSQSKAEDLLGTRIRAIQKPLVRSFTHVIDVAAMCNAPVDHRVLCQVVSSLAKEVDGIIDFDVLEAPLDELGMTRCSWLEDHAEFWTTVGDANSGWRWLEHHSFHMVK